MPAGRSEVRFVIKGEEAKPLAVFIEPWADEFTIPAGESVIVTLAGETPADAPHAVLEWHEWGLLIWAEVGMLERSVTAQDGTVIITTSPELAHLLAVAEHATFGFPKSPTGKGRRRWPQRKR